MNRAREQYGEHRLRAFIESHRALDPRNFATALIEEIMNFGERNELDDDITAAVIRKI
jgi:serine phosphatase RsbU (regulator of sigma subunit)